MVNDNNETTLARVPSSIIHLKRKLWLPLLYARALLTHRNQRAVTTTAKCAYRLDISRISTDRKSVV